MTTSWLHALLGIIYKAETKISLKKKNVSENKETDSPSSIYRMFTGDMLTIKGES